MPALPAFVVPPLAALLAAGLAVYLAPILIAAAHRYGIVDRPKPPLKLHAEPVPYLGGLVVFVAFVLSLAVTFPFEPRVLAILLAASLVVSVGLVDDLGTLTPKDKFVGQIIAAVVLVKAGVKIDIAVVPFPIDELASVLWLATCMNAFNILDVSDGLATTAGLVGSAGATAIAIANGEPMIATLAAALGGACAGFLWFNKQPARMYLGDTGSMLLGAVLGALAMSGRYSEQNTVSAWFVPLALVAAPLFDLVLVVLARLRARRPIWYGSADHYAVRLKRAGWSARRVAWTTGLLGAAFLGAGVLSTYCADGAALVVVGATVACGVALLVVVAVRYPPPA
jgi:UDP-GlcNAc:undecaprenyl-phosphate/decaprenyl-phosphate GlcNAc-1-phosphate transferase